MSLCVEAELNAMHHWVRWDSTGVQGWRCVRGGGGGGAGIDLIPSVTLVAACVRRAATGQEAAPGNRARPCPRALAARRPLGGEEATAARRRGPGRPR